MQDQLDKKRAETAAICGVIDRAKRIIEGLDSMDIALPSKDHQQNGPATENGTNGTNSTNVAETDSVSQPNGFKWELLEEHFS